MEKESEGRINGSGGVRKELIGEEDWRKEGRKELMGELEWRKEER